MCVASSYKAATDNALIDRLIQLTLEEAAIAIKESAFVSHTGSFSSAAKALQHVAGSSAGLSATTTNGWTACTFAACFGRDVLLRRLIKAGCPADRVNADLAPTPLMKAAQLGHIKCVEYLVTSAKVDLDAVDADNRSALDWAEVTDKKDVADFLRRKGAKRGRQAVMDARAMREADKREAERDLPRSQSEKSPMPTASSARSGRLLADKGTLPKALSEKVATPKGATPKGATPKALAEKMAKSPSKKGPSHFPRDDA
jgi:ankyrin repeat protein